MSDGNTIAMSPNGHTLVLKLAERFGLSPSAFVEVAARFVAPRLCIELRANESDEEFEARLSRLLHPGARGV